MIYHHRLHHHHLVVTIIITITITIIIIIDDQRSERSRNHQSPNCSTVATKAGLWKALSCSTSSSSSSLSALSPSSSSSLLSLTLRRAWNVLGVIQPQCPSIDRQILIFSLQHHCHVNHFGVCALSELITDWTNFRYFLHILRNWGGGAFLVIFYWGWSRRTGKNNWDF